MFCTSLLSSSVLFPTGKTNVVDTGTKLKSRHGSPRMSLDPPPPNPSPKILTNLTRLLWGQALPPQLLISTVRSTWSTAWHLMMSQLAPSDPSGSYTRPTSQFRANFKSPQFSRQKPGTLPPIPGVDGSWEFQDNYVRDGNRLVPALDNANGCKTLREVYKLRRGGYDGRCTVPMLWDAERKEVVCNESYDIIELFNSGLNELACNSELDLSPPSLKKQIEEWNRVIYPKVNNGVYRCGFAQSQEAYDTAVNELFITLDMLNDHLGSCRYLCREMMTLADVCLFTTLIRFDLVYNVLFKCTKKKLIEYPNLHGYMREIYQIPKVAATCNFGAISDGYYKILFPLNPGSIRPVMPSVCEHEVLSEPHNREYLSAIDKNIQVYV
ncbi:hypothetical protein F0562_002397 [Nyssa sinensis]|uniref:GST C-terminal domain-containing protein n=1 Tax=Nyssa sinensis TaxID=561372 RepID=A0A5J5C5S4_9ASTE|nr:hypothetical protein F0562_002397 [Nyssa sinensis]